MVTITQGQKVPESDTLVVLAPTGDYADVDLINCGEEGSSEATGMYAAQFIQYGPLVYQYNTPEELGAAIVAVDTNSTHDAAVLFKEEEARKLSREKGMLQPENPVSAPDAIVEPAVDDTITKKVVDDVDTIVPDVAGNDPANDFSNEPASIAQEAPVILEVVPEIPAVDPLPVMPSSTPEVAPSLVESVVAPALDVSTTTQE